QYWRVQVGKQTAQDRPNMDTIQRPVVGFVANIKHRHLNAADSQLAIDNLAEHLLGIGFTFEDGYITSGSHLDKLLIDPRDSIAYTLALFRIGIAGHEVRRVTNIQNRDKYRIYRLHRVNSTGDTGDNAVQPRVQRSSSKI